MPEWAHHPETTAVGACRGCAAAANGASAMSRGDQRRDLYILSTALRRPFAGALWPRILPPKITIRRRTRVITSRGGRNLDEALAPASGIHHARVQASNPVALRLAARSDDDRRTAPASSSAVSRREKRVALWGARIDSHGFNAGKHDVTQQPRREAFWSIHPRKPCCGISPGHLAAKAFSDPIRPVSPPLATLFGTVSTRARRRNCSPTAPIKSSRLSPSADPMTSCPISGGRSS